MHCCQFAAMRTVESSNSPVVDVCRITKRFGRSAPVLNDVSFSIRRGEMVALIGASGSGKSTLIRSIAGLLALDHSSGPDGEASNSIRLFDRPMQRNGRINGAAQEMRARTGVIFQQFNLVPRLTVLTNVCLGRLGQMPALRGMLGQFTGEERRNAIRALDRVGMAEHALKRGSELSGGQQQRAAIARTLVQGAEFLIADEPIASLDPASARRVMDILADMNRRDGITVLVSLHQVDYALKYCPRTIALRRGTVAYDGPSGALTPDLLSDLYGAESSEILLQPQDHPRSQELAPMRRRHDGDIAHLAPLGPLVTTDTRIAPAGAAHKAFAISPAADRRTA
jgi:phosphonate transport system ATP-binding protein